MKILLTGLMALTLSACDGCRTEDVQSSSSDYYDQPSLVEEKIDLDAGWRSWKNEYHCNAEQLTLVSTEAEICTRDETGHKATYCYGLAKQQHCTKYE